MQSVSSKISVGRPKDERMLGCFNSLCIWLENESDTELYTVDEIYDQMCKIARGEGEVCRRKQLKQKLKDCYGDHVFLAEMYGRNDVVRFRNMANYKLNERCYSD